jgi:hypothetical protein
MGKSRRRQAAGRENYAREDPEYAVGQRVQRGEAFGTIADVISTWTPRPQAAIAA